MGADKPTQRALLWCLAAALQRLPRTTAIPSALRLAAKHHSYAGYAIIMVMKHYGMYLATNEFTPNSASIFVRRLSNWIRSNLGPM